MTEHRLLQLLRENNLKIATAESCTGGLVSGLLCDISGISTYFEEGYVTYSENAKIKNLAVSQSTLEHFGVVSVETAVEMAKGAMTNAKANCSVATTGVAGPTGGTQETPVGCVCFAWCVRDAVFSERVIFEGTRMQIRMQAATYALERLCDLIEECMKE